MRSTAALLPIAFLATAAVAFADTTPADATPHPAAPAAAPSAAGARKPSEASKPAPIAVGTMAPAFDVAMTSTDGRTLTLADAKGSKGTLIFFTCNHCPYVKAWQTRMVAVGNSALDRGVGVIAVNSNDPSIVPGDSIDGMKELATGKGYRFPYVVDAGSKLARAFGAGRTPEVFLLDSDGRVVYHGAIDDNSEDAEAVTERWLQDAVSALAEGKEIAVKETKAIGCSIKFSPQG